MGDDHQLRAPLGVLDAGALLLAHRLDRHTVPGECGGDLGQHTRPVGHVEADVIAGDGLPHRAHHKVGVGGLTRATAAVDPVPGDRDQVAQDGAGRRRSARPAAVEHQLPSCLALHEHGVERLAHGSERVAARDHRRVDPRGDGAPVCAQLADREELDHVPHRAGAGHVGGGDVGHALAVHVSRRNLGVESKAGQDGHLGCRIEALDVRCRVGLRVAQRGRLRQSLVKARAGLVHPCQDEVGGAVHDPQHAPDPVASQGLAQWAQQRDGPRDGRLVVEVDAVLLGGGEQCGPVLG